MPGKAPVFARIAAPVVADFGVSERALRTRVERAIKVARATRTNTRSIVPAGLIPAAIRPGMDVLNPLTVFDSQDVEDRGWMLNRVFEAE